MTTKKPTVGIIGAGLAGLTTAALLTQKGYQVHLFEKEEYLGGRALSFHGESLGLYEYRYLLSKYHMHAPFAEPSFDTIFEKKMLEGYSLDLGYHVIGGGVVSNLQGILSSLGEHVDMLGSRLAYIRPGGYDFPFLTLGNKVTMFPRILRLMMAGESTMQKLDLVPMSETIQKYGQGKMKLTLELFSRVITTVNNLDRISTGETLRAQKGLLGGATPVGYPKYGLGTISKTLAEYIKKNGGTIHVHTPVTKILIDSGSATGLNAGGREYYVDNVISNMLVQELFSIIPEHQFPSDYVRSVKTLEGTGSLCAYYALKNVPESLVGKPFLFIERNAGVDGCDAVGMIDFMTTMPASGLAPPGRHLVQAYIICTPQEARSKPTLEHLREIVDKQMKQLMPKYQSELEWALYPAIWQLDGVAKTIENVKPEIQSPIKHLFLVGDCVKAPGIGINCALNSAQLAVKQILQHSP